LLIAQANYASNTGVGTAEEVRKKNTTNPFQKKEKKGVRANASLDTSGITHHFTPQKNLLSQNNSYVGNKFNLRNKKGRKGYSKPRTGNHHFSPSRGSTSKSFLSQSMGYSSTSRSKL